LVTLLPGGPFFQARAGGGVIANNTAAKKTISF